MRAPIVELVDPGVGHVIRPLPATALLLFLGAVPVFALADGCKVGKIAELPVTMNGLRPMVTAKINGVDAQFLADSGAFFSLISPASAAEYQLAMSPTNVVLQGIGGTRMARVTTVKEFTLAGVPIHNVQFAVGGGQIVGAVGLLGQNVFLLARRRVRPIPRRDPTVQSRTVQQDVMVYWSKDGEAYSVVDIA